MAALLCDLRYVFDRIDCNANWTEIRAASVLKELRRDRVPVEWRQGRRAQARRATAEAPSNGHFGDSSGSSGDEYDK